jgi:hypothetical protein
MQAGASAALAKKGWNLKERKLRVVRMGTQQRRRQQIQAVTLNARVWFEAGRLLVDYGWLRFRAAADCGL